MGLRRHLGLALVLVVASAPGCGKDANLSQDVHASYPHARPEAPVQLDEPEVAWTSGHPIAANGSYVVALDRANGTAVVLDPSTLEELYTTEVGARPGQVLLGPDGVAWVTVAGERQVARLDPNTGELLGTTELHGQPWGIAMSPAGHRVYVTLRDTGETVTLSRPDAEILSTTPTGPTARGVATRDDFLVVAAADRLLRHDLDADGHPGASPDTLGLRRGTPADHLLRSARLDQLAPSNAFAVTASATRDEVLAVHTQGQTGDQAGLLAAAEALGPEEAPPEDVYTSWAFNAPPPPEFDVELGPFSYGAPTRPVEPVVSRVDFHNDPHEDTGQKRLPVKDPATGTPMLGLLDQPSDAAHHPTWSLLFVTGRGSDNVLVFNTNAADPMVAPVASIAVGPAPEGVAFSPDGATAYVLNGHDLTVSEIDLQPIFDAEHLPATPNMALTEADIDVVGVDATIDPVNLTHARTTTIGVDPAPEDVQRGRRLFTFSRNENLSLDGQFACGTCHVEGGTEDKMIWFVGDGPRQTPRLAGRLEGTAPFNWLGSKPELRDNMVQTVERMGGHGLSEGELADLEAFLVHGTERPENPNVHPGGLTDQQQIGQALFYDPEVGCATCHSGLAMTDGELHDVGTTNPEEDEVRGLLLAAAVPVPGIGQFDTPSLRDLWTTAPYLHDGSAATLMDVLERTSTTMGYTAHLTQSQKEALVAFLLTL